MGDQALAPTYFFFSAIYNASGSECRNLKEKRSLGNKEKMFLVDIWLMSILTDVRQKITTPSLC